MAQSSRQLAHQIITLLEGDLAAAGFELLDVRVFRGGGRLQVRVYLDTEEGINLSGCAKASRTIDMLLEEAGLVDQRYVIEVSSPGIRRPLRTRAQFASHLGERVELKSGELSSRQTIRGRLVAVDEDGVRVSPLTAGDPQEAETPGEVSIPLADIHEANLDPDFDAQSLIRADRRRRKNERRQGRRQRKSGQATDSDGES